MPKLKIPALLAASATLAVVTALFASPANAVETAAPTTCVISDAPSKVSLGLDRISVPLTPTTNCPDGTDIQFRYTATFPDRVPTDDVDPDYSLSTYSNGPAKAVVSTSGEYPFDVTSSGNVLAGQTMQATYTAFVDAGRADTYDNEPTFTYETTLTVLRATRVPEFEAEDTSVSAGDFVRFTATVQRADWDAHQWRPFTGNGIYDLQFKADGTGSWTTVGARQGGNDSIFDTARASGDYRVKYRGDVVSGVSYSDPVHVTVR